MPDPKKTTLVVAGLIRADDSILLVQQQGADDPSPSWSLPGGMVDADEFLCDALSREVREETGLQVGNIGELIYAVHVEPVDEADLTTVGLVFEVLDWKGELIVHDPDDLILAVSFVPLEEALSRLESLPWQTMRQPIVAYLRGVAAPGAVWLYRGGSGRESETLIACLDGEKSP
jgi:8-oxo-dGTP diphosphatase